MCVCMCVCCVCLCFGFCVGEGNESQSSRAVGPCWPHVCAQPEALVLGCAASYAGVWLGLSGREEWEGRVGQGYESACYGTLRPVTTEGKKHTDRVFSLPSFEDPFEYNEKYTCPG